LAGGTNTNRTITGVVLNDGTYYFLYSVPANPNLIAGVVQGNAPRTTAALLQQTQKTSILKDLVSGMLRFLGAMLHGNP
jgi:hypothetical protein